MKKLAIVFASLLLAFSISACSSKPTQRAGDSTDKIVHQRETSQPESGENVTITLTRQFFLLTDETPDELITSTKNVPGIIEVTADETGTVQMTMTQEFYSAYMEQMRAEIAAMFPNSVFPSVKRIQLNEDVSEVLMYVDKAMFDADPQISYAIYGTEISVQMYHAFNQDGDGFITNIRLVDETGTEFQTVVLPDALATKIGLN